MNKSPTKLEATILLSAIQPIFRQRMEKYDTAKYPSGVYESSLREFTTPSGVTALILRDALLWKYGRLGRARIPSTLEKVISEVQVAWPKVVPLLSPSPKKTFDNLRVRMGSGGRFITIAFLLHLLFSEEIPIIDRHNFYAVNLLMANVRPSWHQKKMPSNFDDIATVAEFTIAVLSAWGETDPATRPNFREFDKFLMMHGKSLRPRKGRHRKVR